MIQSGHWDKNGKLDIKILKNLMEEKFRIIDYKIAKEDVFPFIKDPEKTELWSSDFFISITEDRLKTD